MNILDIVMNARDGAAVRDLGSQFGLDEGQTASALSSLVPALAEGFQRNLQRPEGLASLVSALTTGQHQRYVEDPSALAADAAVPEGNGILGHVFGSKDVSRAVASRAASQTGLGVDTMKRMLPLVASLMMGAFSQQQRTAGGAQSPAALAGKGSLVDLVTPLLDRDRDGSIVDDVGGIVGRMLGGS
jgi:hypothetical protein